MKKSTANSAILVRDFVGILRRSGCKAHDAHHDAAEIFDIHPRVVREICNGGRAPLSIADRIAKVETKIIAFMDREITKAEEYTKTLREKRDRVARDHKCDDAPHYSPSADG